MCIYSNTNDSTVTGALVLATISGSRPILFYLGQLAARRRARRALELQVRSIRIGYGGHPTSHCRPAVHWSPHRGGSSNERCPISSCRHSNSTSVLVVCKTLLPLFRAYRTLCARNVLSHLRSKKTMPVTRPIGGIPWTSRTSNLPNATTADPISAKFAPLAVFAAKYSTCKIASFSR